MGVNGHSKCSTTTIISAIREKIAVSVTDQQHNPVFNVDINWLTHNKTKSNESIKVRTSKVLEIMRFFLDCGFSVKPVAAPEKYHCRKRVCVKRRANKVVLASSAIADRHQLNNIN